MKFLITGGTNGMGKGVAKALASMDGGEHEVIILCRSRELGEEFTQEMNNKTLCRISLVICDLSKLSDTNRAVEEITQKHDYLDGIFINAGIGYAPRRIETEDGMDSHFQVNYLSQFMLTLKLLDLLKKSSNGGRVIFNATKYGKIFWDDLQMKNKWNYEDAIFQGMVAKRMFLAKLSRENRDSNLSFIGFQISKTVWTNQLNIIPRFMRTIAGIMKIFGTFISIDECGDIMAPLFTESIKESRTKSGKLITWKKNSFIEIQEDSEVTNLENQDRLWKLSKELCFI